MSDLSRYSKDLVLRNGCPARLRAIRPDDKQALLDGFHRLTGRSVYFRFLGARRRLTEQELKYFTEVDFVHHVALVAALIHDGAERPVGVGRYIETGGQAPERTAEIAFAVDDAHQNLGIGTALFEHIVTLAQHNGIARLQADVLPDNSNMLEILAHSGLRLETTTDGGVVHIEFPLAGQAFNRHYT